MKTISEIRKSFDSIEHYIKKLLKQGKSKINVANALIKKWKQEFGKKITEQNAMEYLSMIAKKGPRTLKRKSRGGDRFSGAPLDYTMQPGIYISPGVNNSSYAKTPIFIEKDFVNPEIAQQQDPITGQPPWPVVPTDMGNNCVSFTGGSGVTIKGGKKKKFKPKQRTRKNKKNAHRGGKLTTDIAQLYARPIPSSVPPSNLQVWQDKWQGLSPFPSSDPMNSRLV